MKNDLPKTEEEWRKKLTPEQYRILRQKGTEAPFTGALPKGEGMYACAACGNVLFSPTTKFESGSGWPSFYDVVSQGAVKLSGDESMGMRRVEVKCARCGSHLGHLFDDGPAETTGKRYCINAGALKLMPKK